MRILLLTPYFFPYQNPRAYRWTAIARQWAEWGWEVHAVCSKHPSGYGEEKWEGVFLHHAGFNSAKEAIYRSFPSVPRRGEPQKGGKLPALMGKLNDLILKPWYWPDDAFLWISPSRKKGMELLARDRFDAIVSVSLPFSAHWAGRSLKKQFPDVKWLADIGDPFVQKDHPLNNAWLYGRKNLAAELSVLQIADLAVVTNEGLKKAYLESYPGLQTPLHCIPPLASPLGPFQEKKEGHGTALNLGYFGSFFPRIREPEAMLRFFEQLLKTRQDWILHIFGPVFENFWPVFDRFSHLKPHLRFHGSVERSEVVTAMRNMDVLIMLGNTTGFQLPSKWADYLASGRPVLHLMQTPDDPGLNLVKNAPGVLSLPLYYHNPLPDLEWLSRQQTGDGWGEMFSPSTIANTYAVLLRD